MAGRTEGSPAGIGISIGCPPTSRLTINEHGSAGHSYQKYLWQVIMAPVGGYVSHVFYSFLLYKRITGAEIVDQSRSGPDDLDVVHTLGGRHASHSFRTHHAQSAMCLRSQLEPGLGVNI